MRSGWLGPDAGFEFQDREVRGVWESTTMGNFFLLKQCEVLTTIMC